MSICSAYPPRLPDELLSLVILHSTAASIHVAVVDHLATMLQNLVQFLINDV